MATNSLRTHHVEVSWLEPSDAVRALGAWSPLLLDGMGAHPEARYAYVALTPKLEARCRNGAWTTTDVADGTQTSDHPNGLAGLDALIAPWKFAQSQPGFTGGWVGYFAYEFVTNIEPTLPRRAMDAPQAVLRLCRDALVFDRLRRTVTLWVNDLPGEGAAAARMDEMVQALTQFQPRPTVPLVHPDWTPAFQEADFCASVARVQQHIRHGDLFQANIATRFDAEWNPDPIDVYDDLAHRNPSPFMGLMDFGDHALVSNSPEQLFSIHEGRISSRPIAGTRRRGKTDDEDDAMEQELLQDAKEQAEHMMLVDLLRNDVARVSQPGTVSVTEHGSVERYARVMHLVSNIEGTLRNDASFVDCLAAMFPGGTITGAPKHRACVRIHEAEVVPRGVYTGSAGFLSWDHKTAHWNILIRTMVLARGRASVHAGSGIVRDSVPALEWKEAGHKADALLRASPTKSSRIGEVTTHHQWDPPTPKKSVPARVLIVDNYDSFVHNIADYCSALGATVHVARNDAVEPEHVNEATHVVLSPGPGWPDDAGATLHLAHSLIGSKPLLGVCLGHQAMAQAAGATIDVATTPVHGEVDTVHATGSALLPDGAHQATRYHSLIVDEKTLPDDWMVTARLDDGTIMAIEHATEPAFGLQFHPESLGTPGGMDILMRFLETQ